MNNVYAVKGPNGRFVYGSDGNNMLDAMYTAASLDSDLREVVYYNGSREDEAVRKRVKRAGYVAVPVRYRSKGQ